MMMISGSSHKSQRFITIRCGKPGHKSRQSCRFSRPDSSSRAQVYVFGVCAAPKRRTKFKPLHARQHICTRMRPAVIAVFLALAPAPFALASPLTGDMRHQKKNDPRSPFSGDASVYRRSRARSSCHLAPDADARRPSLQFPYRPAQPQAAAAATGPPRTDHSNVHVTFARAGCLLLCHVQPAQHDYVTQTASVIQGPPNHCPLPLEAPKALAHSRDNQGDAR